MMFVIKLTKRKEKKKYRSLFCFLDVLCLLHLQETKERKVKNLFSYDKNLSYSKLCELFIRNGNLVSDGKSIMVKAGNSYHTLPRDNLQMELRKFLTPETRMNMSPYQLNIIIDLIKQNPDIRIDTSVCNTGRVIFRNGIYNALDGNLYQSNDDYNWAVVDADYRKNATLDDAPVFYKFLMSSLDLETSPEKAELLLEIIGYGLSDYTVAKKGFFFIGESSSGKSKMLEFLQKLVGDESVSQIAFPMIGNRFSLGQLEGKRLNICTELPSNKFPCIDAFKALTSGDRIYGEMKGKDGCNYYPRVKLLTAGNCVPFPANTDGTSSIIDRMVFLMFTHTIPREQWNINLVEDLLDERDVICSLAMQRLKRLVTNNFDFTVPGDSRRFTEGYGNMLNAFRLFIEEACVLQEGLHESSQQLWDCYLAFCSDNNFPKGITRQLFAQKLATLDGIQKQRVWENGKQVTIFKGVAIRNGLDDIGEAVCGKSEKDKGGIEKSDTKIRKEPTIQEKLDSSCTEEQYEFDVSSKFLRG